jgi:hypothetical protein
MNPLHADADEYYINVNLNTELELPNGRDTVLHFFEQLRKGYPELRNFYTRESGDLVLEGDKDQPSYRWVAIEPRRLCSGHVNPELPKSAYKQHELVLELAPHLLSVSTLDCEALDVLFGFDFTYQGNHDEIVAEALGLGPGLEGLMAMPGGRVVHYEPSLTMALDESCETQCRLTIETRTSAAKVRSGDYGDDQISLYFTVRRYWGGRSDLSFLDSFRHQRAIGEEIVQQVVIPRVVQPLAQAIASR